MPRNTVTPPEGVIPERWYWVKRQNSPDGWFPASWDEDFGWNNGDTWEDFHCEVIEWKLIPLPEELP